MEAEKIVIECMLGERKPPASILPLVKKWQDLRKVADSCESYPRSVDQQMNKLYDAAIVLVM